MALQIIVGGLLVQEHEDYMHRQNLRINHRQIRDTSNPFELPERTFLKLFRLNKETTHLLIQQLEQHMDGNERSTAVPCFLKIMVTLHFYGHGSYQIGTGHIYNFGLSQPSVSRAIDIVTNIIHEHLVGEWIRFPTTPQERRRTKEEFLQKFNFPNTIGVIDCTHVAIISPPADHPVYPAAPYYNRKGFYSINCQIICDANLKIINMNARFPGSVHDSAIWRTSTIRRHMEDQYLIGENSYLLGDSGYPLQPWLMTPFDNPGENTPQSRYNDVFIRARTTIERVNGILKCRFRCLLKHRVLHYNPIKSAKIIYSCGVLHNIALFYNNQLPDEREEMNDNDARDNDQVNHNRQNVRLDFLRDGRNIRNAIVQRYFL